MCVGPNFPARRLRSCCMKSKAHWASGAGMRVLGAECLDDKWLISAMPADSGTSPSCSVPPTARHGHYDRQLQDLPEQGVVVMLSVHVQRWICQNPHCKQRTFSRLSVEVAAPYARRTGRSPVGLGRANRVDGPAGGWFSRNRGGAVQRTLVVRVRKNNGSTSLTWRP